ncbi:hypothetical protein Poli38472_010916 [Pythium oligandrum]|uniref:Protein kinase domain-containing protein n=1 Tax=Pythium oligandrum TaxID=41045 RepID=A0A8K1CG09_PYTOL|nr:hypothetical protein Poli38472_010916 [Pythium oligandrum]|eukprot:TMW61853.1 hypothetical protein Poli38472_010916 [Pythium oligandrum]
MSTFTRVWALFASLVLLATAEGSINCPTLSKEENQMPMLISYCSGPCGYEGFCVYFPYRYRDRCYGLLDSQCAQGDTCVFECFHESPKSVYLYRTWHQLSDWIDRFMDEKKALVNASLVQTWNTDNLSTAKQFGLYSGLSMYDVRNYDDGPYIPPIETIEMNLPDNLHAAKWNATNIAINGIKCPEFLSEPQHYDGLSTLRLEDCDLTEFPWGKSTAPNLKLLFIGNNRIKELPSLPAGLETIDLSGNLLKAIPSGLKDMNLSSVHLRHNPLGNIDAKSFPSTMWGTLVLKNTSMTKMPTDLDRLTTLNYLSLSYNNLGENFDVSVLPPQIGMLDMVYCGLTSLPQFDESSVVHTLDISGNSIPTDDFSGLPATITDLTRCRAQTNPSSGVLGIENASYNALPLDLTTVNITFSQIDEIPLNLLHPVPQSGDLAHNKIKQINGTTALRAYLQYNEIEEYDNAASSAKYLDLSFNKLRSFRSSGADVLKALYLRGNNLTTVPESLIGMRNLQVLDLRDNPITNYIPSSQEWDFFQRVSVVMMDASQLHADCKDLVQFKDHLVWNPKGSLEPGSPSSDDPNRSVGLSNSTSGPSISTATIALIVIALTLVVALAGFMWHRRRKRQPLSKPDTIDFSTVSTVRSEKDEVMLWSDEELLRHRLDPKLVQVEHFLASGTYGEVFLATYEGQHVVVKRLKNRDSSRVEIQQIVSEIKMMAAFRFPKIVRFVGVVWTKESDIAVVTEYMENGDLRAHLDKNKRRARDAGRSASSGLLSTSPRH